MTIRAVFLDLDGTTVDTEPRNRRAIEATAQIGGYRIQPHEWDFLAGQGDGIIYEQLAAIKPDLREVFTTAASFVRGCLNAKMDRIHEVKKIAETAEAIRLFRENGMDIVAAVSNSTALEAKASLKQAGYVKTDFDFAMFRDDLDKAGLRAKPFPDPYIEAMRRANEMLKAKAAREGTAFVPLTPQECLILEDSKTGARSGLAAGMMAIQMTDETPALDDNEASEMAGNYGGIYIPLRRAELVGRCREIIAPPAP